MNGYGSSGGIGPTSVAPGEGNSGIRVHVVEISKRNLKFSDQLCVGANQHNHNANGVLMYAT